MSEYVPASIVVSTAPVTAAPIVLVVPETMLTDPADDATVPPEVIVVEVPDVIEAFPDAEIPPLSSDDVDVPDTTETAPDDDVSVPSIDDDVSAVTVMLPTDVTSAESPMPTVVVEEVKSTVPLLSIVPFVADVAIDVPVTDTLPISVAEAPMLSSNATAPAAVTVNELALSLAASTS
jgi:hypothetical protein